MEILKSLALNLWTNHRKKLIAFMLGLIFAGAAAISGIPVSEIKDAARDAAGPEVSAPVVGPQIGPMPIVVTPGTAAK